MHARNLYERGSRKYFGKWGGLVFIMLDEIMMYVNVAGFNIADTNETIF